MRYYLLFVSLFMGISLLNAQPEMGVSLKLAEHRKATIHNLEYLLDFSIPDSIHQKCAGKVNVLFTLDRHQEVVLDFKAPRESLKRVMTNGKPVRYKFLNEHIIVSGTKGKNNIELTFDTPEQSINRREEFLYTLLVPDRARTLFPCFDQPNLKARFTLTLSVPEGWVAISNGKLLSSSNGKLTFSQTEPLSTYLFSVVAGKLQRVTKGDISLYHRETDPARTAQLDQIFEQVNQSLKWLEEYTGIDYPFAKYDMIILPGFQYGGMEHTGATLYSDNVMFLSPNPTINEKLARANLIAHETAHMWFGDYVTMDWFSDVWTKEVFANYFSSQIVAPQFPEVNHGLNFMFSYAPSSYVEDRTAGSNPIQQQLANLQDAGLVYGNIIYKKSPMVMSMLVETVGEERFQQAIREYLNTYAYGNATWDNLITILDRLTPLNLQEWSDAWIKERGMPTIRVTKNSITQHDPRGRNLIWGQPLALMSDTVCKVMLDKKCVENPLHSLCVVPNSDGRGYGYFELDSATAEFCMKNLMKSENEVIRGSILITLYENLLNGNLSATDFMQVMMEYLPTEQNPLLSAQALTYVKSCFFLIGKENPQLEQLLWTMAPKSVTALRTYAQIVRSEQGIENLYKLWQQNQLSEKDATAFSYQLAVLMPDRAEQITTTQLSRVTNSDRIRQYQFIAPAVSSLQTVRDSVFNALLQVDNRAVEPWAATALALLNHPLRQADALKYLRPGLDVVREVQKTGDIFFPKAWCESLLAGHESAEARQIVDRFFEDNKNYPDKLAGKIKQSSHHLYLKIKK